MDTTDTPILDLGSFDFTPDWAKKSAGVSAGKFSGGNEDKKQASADADRGPRKSFGAKKQFSRPGGSSRFQDDRGAAGKGDMRGRRSDGFEASRPKPLDVDVKVLPETKALGTIIRKLQQSPQAYKLKDLAFFLLDNPSTVLLKITQKQQPEGVQKSPVQFHQCKACSFASLSREDVVEHALAAHLGDYYEARTIEVEPPKGNFNCVAKCGLTGELLGPPNVHEFNSVVREMIRTKFPGMSEAEYRAKIEMVRDAETIETWRKGATKKTVFVAKGAGEDAAQLTREQAEAEFRRNILDNLVVEPKSLLITAEAALKSPVRSLVWAARDALQAERRSPYGMIFALRGAFHHRKMKFFRANDGRGPEFVVAHELKEFDMTHAVPELAKVAAFIAEHPCSNLNEICALDPDAARELAWLVTTGHVVSFTNGVYSAVEKFPKYGPQWRNRKVKSEPAPVAEETASEAPAPAQPTPAAEDGASKIEAPVANEAPVAEEKKEDKVAEDETAAKLAE